MAKLIFLGFLLNLLLLVNAEFCVTTKHCKEGFVCFQRYCICPLGKVLSPDGKSCLEIAIDIGAACKEDIQCLAAISGPSVCTKDGLCGCKPGYRYVNATCAQVSDYNGLCTSDNSCYDGINWNALKCDSGVCSCNIGADYYLRGDSDCRISGQHTNVCFFDVDCGSDDKCCEFNYGPEGVCVSNLNPNNTCSYNIFPEKYNDLKLLDGNGNNSMFNLNLTCGVHEDCFNVVNNSFCDFRANCVCREGFVYQESLNACVAGLGSSCNDDNDCHIKYSICNANKICTCKNYFINSNYNDKCFKPARDIGASCARDENCYSLGINAVCVRNRCECNENSKFDEKLMLCRAQNDTCNDYDKCIDNCRNKPHSTCINGKCICDVHYLDKDSKCLPDIGYECSLDNKDCIIANASCVNNICECDKGFIKINNRTCIKVQIICDNNCKHKPHSKCENGKCLCEENYLDQNDNCLPDLGYECNMETNQCKIANAACINEKCECIDGYVKESKRKCKKEVTGDKPCTTIIQIYTNNHFTIIN